MFKIAVASDNGSEISEKLTNSLLFLIYEIDRGEIVACEKRAQVSGVMATVHDCDVVVAGNCPDPIAELLSIKGIRAVTERQRDAGQAVQSIMRKLADESAGGFKTGTKRAG
jgi:predicted Fe-Mo cluster-binding NifX family protein